MSARLKSCTLLLAVFVLCVLHSHSSAQSSTSNSDLVVYEDDLLAPWFHNTYNSSATLVSTEQAASGNASMKITSTSPWGWVSMHHGPWNTQGFNPAPYKSVDFEIYPTSSATSVAVFLENDRGESFPKIPRGTFTANAWSKVSVPMSELNPNNQMVGRLFIQDFSGVAKTYYVDNIRFVGEGPTLPAAPSLIAPANGSTNAAPNQTLSWNAAAGADTYRLQVSTSSAFSTLVIDQAGIQETSYEAGGLARNTSYYWRVRASNSGGASNWSPVWSFTTAGEQLSAPELSSPSNGAADQPTTLTLRWNAVLLATSYDLQISTTQDFSNLVVNASTILETSRTVGPLDPATTYYWRVRSVQLLIVSPWSNAWSFTTAGTGTGLATPSLVSPADNATNQPTNPTLAWNAVHQAESYHLQLSLNPNFNTLVSEYTSITATSRQVGGLSLNTQYYWRVRAQNSSGESNWSQAWNFTTADSAPPAQTYTLNATVQFPPLADPSQAQQADYKLVGLPGASNEPITTYLPGTPGADWQVYWDNGAAENYLIPYNGGGEFTFSVGKAFWMIKNGDWAINAVVPVPLLNESSEAEIPLNEGWNLITNPFMASVSWEDVQSVNSLADPLYVFANGSFIVADALEPYTGYYVFNTPSLETLRIPSGGSSNSLAQDQTNSALSVSSGWRINVTLHSKSLTDNLLWFGTSPDAQREYDALDFRKPRGFTSAATFFDRPEWDAVYRSFATDIRHPFENVEQWQFSVAAVPRTSAEIAFSGMETVPPEFSVYLIDEQSKTAVDLRSTRSYNFFPLKLETRFAVIVGTREEIEKRIQTVSSPTTIALGANYPNPFNPSTTIPFELPQQTSLSISVYNMLGQQVKTVFAGTLTPGRYNIEWDGTDASGSVVPTGAYFYRLSTNDGQSLTRNMILTK
ncbi:MAG: T9SS type A sorting domain-containing protein [Ignavibacteriae bacterium]|nr:T9SS type A sorting domain-containing protein [Ignavibacteriota bacterium]